jgi:hypothetical protein
MTKILHIAHTRIAQFFYTWAMNEIDPLHPDVPRIVQRQAQLRDKLAKLYA